MKQDFFPFHLGERQCSRGASCGSMPLKTRGLWSWPSNGLVREAPDYVLAHIHWSPEAFSCRESSIKTQKSPSQPDLCQRPAGSSGVLDLASSPWIHSTCHSPTICPHSQPSSLDRLSPSLCMFTTKSSSSCSRHWLTSLSLLILQCHEIYDPHQNTSESQKEQYVNTTLGNRFKSVNLDPITPSNTHRTSLSLKQNYNSVWCLF